jgi:hypothetical protein
LIFAAAHFNAPAQQPDRFTTPAADPSHDLTTAEFFKDLGGSFRALASVQNVVPVLAGGAALGLATIPEQDLERHFAPGNVWGKWAAPGKYIGNPLLLGGVSSALFAFSRKSQDRRFRSFSYALIQGSIMSTAVIQPTKAAFRRLRPNEENHHSFPSGHGADTFMYATVIAEHYGWKAAAPAYAIASYVAMTRLADRKHHITDAVAGAGIGFLIGRTVSARMRMKVPSRISMNVYRTRGGFAGTVRIGLP